MKYIGVDLGSSYVKAVLIDLDNRIVENVQKRPFPKKEYSENPRYFEVKASAIVDVVKESIDLWMGADVKGVILATAMHGFVYCVGEQDARYISWQDMRCTEKMPDSNISYLDYIESLVGTEMVNRNGVRCKPSLGMCNLYTMLKQNGNIPWDGTLYTVGSYIIRALTGNNICHISNAAPLGLVDVVHHCWNKKVIELLGFSRMELPVLATSDFQPCGKYYSKGYSVDVFPDYGDMQISVLGSCPREGDVVVNIGTAAQVIRYSKDYITGDCENRPYFNDAYLSTISNMPSGRNLDVLIDFFKNEIKQLTGQELSSEEIWEQVHIRAGDSRGLWVDTGFFPSAVSKSGAICGITPDNLDLGTIFSAAFANMSATYWKYIQLLCKDSEEPERIICAGGVSWKVPELKKVLANNSGKNCVLSPVPDEVMIGLYRLSLVFSGLCTSLDETLEHLPSDLLLS